MRKEQVESITISKIALKLRPYDTISDSNASFFRKLFDNCVDEFNPTCKTNPQWAKKEESYNPLHNMEQDTLTRYCNGKNEISPKSLIKIKPFLNEDRFTHYYNKLNIPPEEDELLYDYIKQYYPQANKEVLASSYWNVLQKLIEEGSCKKSSVDRRRVIIPISQLCSADTEGDFENKIINAIKKIALSSENEFSDKNELPVFHVKEKIKDKMLCKEIENDLNYFPFVNSAFIEASNDSGKPCEFILKSVNRQYERLEQKNLNEREIVENMQTYFAGKAAVKNDSPECRVITSYFIQLCEVFRGTSRKNSRL